jgi:hypothetical protein
MYCVYVHEVELIILKVTLRGCEEVAIAIAIAIDSDRRSNSNHQGAPCRPRAYPANHPAHQAQQSRTTCITVSIVLQLMKMYIFKRKEIVRNKL